MVHGSRSFDDIRKWIVTRSDHPVILREPRRARRGGSRWPGARLGADYRGLPAGLWRCTRGGQVAGVSETTVRADVFELRPVRTRSQRTAADRSAGSPADREPNTHRGLQPGQVAVLLAPQSTAEWSAGRWRPRTPGRKIIQEKRLLPEPKYGESGLGRQSIKGSSERGSGDTADEAGRDLSILIDEEGGREARNRGPTGGHDSKPVDDAGIRYPEVARKCPSGFGRLLFIYAEEGNILILLGNLKQGRRLRSAWRTPGSPKIDHDCFSSQGRETDARSCQRGTGERGGRTTTVYRGEVKPRS